MIIYLSFFVILILIYLIYYYFKAFHSWHPIPSQKITENLYCIKTKIAQFYIITSDKEFILIDTGDYSNHKKLKEEFDILGISPESISAIFLTHSDYDHVAGLDFFQNAKIYASKKEKPLFERTKPRFSFFYYNKKITTEINYLDEASIINIGKIKVQMYETPGHTIGHAIYIVSIEKAIQSPFMFSGDALNIKKGKAVMNYRIHTAYPKTAKKSIQKIASFEPIKLICTAHFGIYDDLSSVFQEWRK